MSWQALIHYKNDEEVIGPKREDFADAVRDIQDLVEIEKNSTEGFDPEDVQFIQVENINE